ncbi:helix-turn-helix transcriptional regulator [Mammaliicoccus sciuri]|uniref:Helix-turn-helix transcriptional regulator n=1 Tax=Mammaliicoccus sciuri TaxID=1296 RepID=A0AB37HLK6_MAMSC|nr:helix-turn-helix transcriptional regulator [Mammaliicoccus sciuri]QRN90759.1 helix-turn-helix transcriptional regulator [Mammaliicoccus sciuri]
MEYKSARKILSENLQSLMNRKNVTQKELSEELGVSQSTISNWIQETKYPRIDKIEMLAQYFNVPKSTLIEDKDNYATPKTTAFHLDGKDLTKEELEDVQKYIDFIREKRNK